MFFFFRAGPPQRIKANGFSRAFRSVMILSVKVSQPRPR